MSRRRSEMLSGRLDIRHLSENMLTSHDPHHAYLALKRVIDTLAALAALLLLAPLLLIVGAADQARFAGAGAVHAAAHPQGRLEVYDLQVPHDADRRGRAAVAHRTR